MNTQIANTIISYLLNHDVSRIGVFGSFVRGEETQQSDVDLLVDFRKPFGLLKLIRIERELSELIGRKVDLVTTAALKNKKLKKHVMQDLQIIYE